ncbi:endolytic transglycosylase MltG [Pullulanibacillus sp. KACC 23026]|uniref:endolytic transglycosylase MltG n=1 Tax=Pullulanibacillus sp. KACC 23026 TaxID=3028315 RepID=UPI0023B14D53|nr:endolytic transglycosylase MltG [Pullulanibacillus sp. KACC 23026]WEG14098.1 endolytic transglycosylase MltG [Pullulanibacillus sp. KACC 23026]
MSETQDKLDKLRKRADEARLVRRIVLIVLAALIIAIAGTAGYTYRYISRSLQPENAASHNKVIVTIPSGSSVKEISTILENKGIIHSGTVFHYFCKYRNEQDFMAGTYQLSPSMSIQTIINTLQSGKVYQPVLLKLTIPEGYWVKDIAATIADKTSLKESDILKKLSDRSYIKSHYLKNYPFLKTVLSDKYKEVTYPLEGYLFPATYSFSVKNPTLDQIVSKMLDKTQSVLNDNKGLISQSSLMNVHDILTMASLVEEEAPDQADREKIAGVFFNRLKKGMPLQTDPTISYALQKHLKNISHSELAFKSPYNTYTNKGLPIGPIDNPSLISIEAVLNPAKTDALYFFARPNGQVLYAKTLAQHNANVNKYKSEWNNQ